MVPALGSTKRKRAARTVDLPAPDGPVTATRAAGAACSEKAASAGRARSGYSTASASMARSGTVPMRRRRRPASCPAAAVAGVGRAEDLEDARRRRLALGAGVELRPGAAERDEDLRRDQQDGQGGLQPQLAPQQAEAEHHGHEADPEAGDEVHGEGGEEGHPQGAHGGDADPLVGRLHLASAVRLAAEGAERGEALDELEEVARQRPEPAPLSLRAPGRLAPEVDHGERDRGDEGHDHDERQPVLGRHPHQQEERDDGRGGGLRQVARVVGVERVQPTGGRGRQLAGPLAGQPARAQGQRMVQQLSRADG